VLELALQAGKVHNLRLACRGFTAVTVPAGQTLSFWAQVGRPGRTRGYVVGRELRQGCLIPSVGGGLCQLSNALFDAGVRAGLTVTERHRHTQIVPGSLAEQGRDATVYWNYVDLRLTSDREFTVTAELTDQELVVSVWGEPRAGAVPVPPSEETREDLRIPNSCASCGVLDCIHNVEHREAAVGRTACLVDEHWPEFDRYLQTLGAAMLLLPLNGRKWNRPAYAWSTDGFSRVVTFPWFTLGRSWASRRLTAQGAARQRELLRQDARLAERMARRLTPDITHLVVSQTLLPHLHALGALGGRTVDVLVTRAPIRALQRLLDDAARRHPESTTLGDFRAPVAVMAAEEAALAHVTRFITPHRAIAALFERRAVVVDWVPPRSVPPDPTVSERIKVGFLGPTVGRKGAFVFRDAAVRLGALADWVALGPLIEGAGFWVGTSVVHRPGRDWSDLPVLVAPSYVENAPRHLLAALASGRSVIATTACGLPPSPGLTLVEPGDTGALCAAIEQAVRSRLDAASGAN
jgi:hypothetical protein